MRSMLNKLAGKRIFLGTTEIAGYYSNLAKGLDELGVNYKYVQLSPNSSGFGTQSKLPFLIKLPYLLAKLRLRISVEPGLYTVHKTKKGILSLSRFLFYFVECLLRIFFVLPWAIFNFDIFCFGARSNIVGIKTGYWDIKLLKLFRKKIIYVYHGSDSRPPYINGSVLHDLLVHDPRWEEKMEKMARKTKEAVRKIDALADVVIANPYSAHFHQKPFINWFSIGAPYCGDSSKAVAVNHFLDNNKPIRILHAPTHRIAKGSAIIEKCIEQLKKEGFLLDLIQLHGRPHHEVIKEINKCDFVIDELYSDALMAGFAVEASYYAKAVIVCGYVDDIDLKQHIPTYYCRPEELRSAVLRFINEPEFRINLGDRAKQFVQNEWSYLKIAERFVKIFAGDVPAEWFVFADQISYFHGFGVSEELVKKSLLSLIQKQGISALQLDDKKILRDAFLRFAGTE